MKVGKVEVKNFRSIRNACFELGKQNVIVGQNNAGKSAIFKALNSFFNFEDEAGNFHNGRHRYNSRTTPVIVVTFTGVPNQGMLKDLSDKGQLIVRFKFEKKKAQYQYKNKGNWANLPETAFQKLKEKVDFLLIPSTRDSDKIHGIEKSALEKIVW